MLTLVFMKIAADLALYYTFAGFFAALFGASSGVMLLILAAQAVIFTLSYAARGVGRRRFLPLLLLALCWLVPGAGLADRIVIAPPALYTVYLAAKNIYEPDRFQQADIFSVFWKVMAGFSVFCALFGKTELVKSMVLPAGLIVLVCSVLLMRSLRHEPQVYCQVRYQAMNVLLICAACVCTLILSSDAFLGTCLMILRTVYNWVISPVLMLVIYLIILIVQVFIWLFSFFEFGELVSPDREGAMEMPDFQELLGLEQSGQSAAGQWLDRIAAAIVILAAAAVVILVFRALSKRKIARQSARAAREVRTGLTQRKERPDDIPAGSPAGRVRAQYRKFLKLFSAQALEREKSDTSLDISRRCRGTFDDQSVGELRSLYIEARYGGRATREDVQRAKKLYTEIKKSSNHT